MLRVISRRLFCAVPNPSPVFAVNSTTPFVGRVGTNTNPRTVAPVITTHVLRNESTISFSCISRNAVAKAVHAAAITNVKNKEGMGVFFKPTIADDLSFENTEIGKGLTPFRVTMFPFTRPEMSEESMTQVRRTRVSANVDHEELARNIHNTYLKRIPLVLECMGDKATGIITQAIAIFNDRVKTHDMSAYVTIKSGQSADGLELVKMEFHLREEPKGTH